MLAGEAGGAAQYFDGIRRLSSFTAVAGMGEAARLLAMSMYGWDDEDDKQARKLLPPWDKDGLIIWLGPRNDESVPYINLSNILPFSIVADSVMSLFKSGTIDKESLKKMMWIGLKPFTEEQYVVDVLRTVVDQRKDNGDPIVNEGMDENESMMRMASNILAPLMPGHV